jgi:hypothetical protein
MTEPPREILVCTGWDILEIYNSGLTYRVLEEYPNPHPIEGNYRRDLWPAKIYVIELPCVVNLTWYQPCWKGYIATHMPKGFSWYHLFGDYKTWVGMFLKTKEECVALAAKWDEEHKIPTRPIEWTEEILHWDGKGRLTKKSIRST